MALKDYYGEADLLDTMSWCGIPYKTLIARLANMYLGAEDKIRRRSRGYCGPTKGTVGTYVKSFYCPPRGKGASTIKDVLGEIERQRALRKKRSEIVPYKPEKGQPESRHERDRWLRRRRNKVAKARYTILSKSYRDEWEKQKPNCVAITRMGGCLVLVDGGSYDAHSRIYLRDDCTGDEAVFVLDRRVSTLIEALTRLAPPNILRGLFDGKTCRLDFSGGFDLDGRFAPFRHIIRVYTGDKVHRTKAKPKKQERS